ncbi:hypothetical protein AVEN_231987-1 [Araneus ventricosus]|uniref:Uncharacterized protein n=1 Tax=Araneus ventricosus TaxID=182803 RepID=A0A4Y2C048_ARAVE|nr:hypothetical protein AVEN_231987-1 [Araneus ventricosus]
MVKSGALYHIKLLFDTDSPICVLLINQETITILLQCDLCTNYQPKLCETNFCGCINFQKSDGHIKTKKEEFLDVKIARWCAREPTFRIVFGACTERYEKSASFTALRPTKTILSVALLQWRGQ